LAAENVEEKKEDLGEILNGDRLVVAPYKLEFMINKQPESICRKRDCCIIHN
jgi:hypothetical protein